jgi:hypothetical protein
MVVIRYERVSPLVLFDGEGGMKCPSCGYENGEGARYCNLCQHSFVKEPAAPYGLDQLSGLRPEPGQEAKEAAQKVLRSQSKGENWFQRHLNWTWVLAQIAVGVITFFLMTVFVTSLFVGSATLPSDESLFASISVIQIVALVLQIASVFGVGGWVLMRKERSLGWLLIFLVPFGWIIFLFLENCSELDSLPVSPASPANSAPAGSPRSSGSIQPGLAPPGLGYRPEKYGP